MTLCSHNVEGETPLQSCGYCIPCDCEIHSFEVMRAHSGHLMISLQEFLEGKKTPLPSPTLQQYKVGASHLTGKEFMDIDARHAALVESMTKAEIIVVLNEVQRLIEEKKNLEKHLIVGKRKLEISIEGNLIEREGREKKVKTSTTARISKQEKAYESMASMLGISIEEAKELIKGKEKK